MCKQWSSLFARGILSLPTILHVLADVISLCLRSAQDNIDRLWIVTHIRHAPYRSCHVVPSAVLLADVYASSAWEGRSLLIMEQWARR